MAATLQLAIENGDRLRDLVRETRRLEDGKVLRTQLRKELRRTGGRLLKEEKRAVRALPSKGQNARRGLPSTRRQVARATQLRVRTAGARAGVVVWVNPKKMPAGKQSVPGYMEGVRPYQRWRHPVFGRDTWVTQRPTPWFYSTASRYGGEAQRAAVRAIDRYAREIESRS
jgi:hypothetical protein